MDLAPGPHGQGDQARQQVDRKIRPGGGLDLGQQVGGERRRDRQALAPADQRGRALMLEDHAQLAERTRDEVEVVRQRGLDAHLAAGDGAEREEGDNLVVIAVRG